MTKDIDQKAGQEVDGKTCSTCGEWKGLDSYSRNKGGKFGVHSKCRDCVKEYNRIRRLTHPEITRGYSKKYKAANRESVALANKEYHERNRERDNLRRIERYRENPERERERNAAYNRANRERLNEKARVADAIRRRDPKVRLENAVVAGVWRAISRGSKYGRRTFALLGYSLEDLVIHLERLFQSGMTWDNYGAWHIDHIIPLSAHNYTTPDDIDFQRAWSLSNLQPLWAVDNMKKHAKLDRPFQPALAFGVPDSTAEAA